MCCCLKIWAGGCDWFSFFFLFSQKFGDCLRPLQGTRLSSHVTTSDSRLRPANGWASFSERVNETFFNPGIERLTGECAEDRRGSGELALTCVRRRLYVQLRLNKSSIIVRRWAKFGECARKAAARGIRPTVKYMVGSSLHLT